MVFSHLNAMAKCHLLSGVCKVIRFVTHTATPLRPTNKKKIFIGPTVRKFAKTALQWNEQMEERTNNCKVSSVLATAL